MKFIRNHLVGIGVVLLAIGVFVQWLGSGSDSADDASGVSRRFGKGQKVMRTPGKFQKKTKTPPAYRAAENHRKAPVAILDEETGEIDSGEYDGFTGHDLEIARTMDKTFWDDDMTNTLAAAIEAADSKNSELRAKAVECAGWYGKDGMETLMLYMADADEQIAEDARAAWIRGLRTIDDDEERASLVAPLTKVLTDPDAIEGMLMALNDLPNIAQMQVMIDIMDVGTDAAYAVARDHYTFMTGEDFTTVEAAQAWLDANWEEEEGNQASADADDEGDGRAGAGASEPRAVALEAEPDVVAAITAAGLDLGKVAKAMAAEAAEEGLTEAQYLEALDERARAEGVSRATYIAESLKDDPALKAE